jgi:hypothetical protein
VLLPIVLPTSMHDRAESCMTPGSSGDRKPIGRAGGHDEALSFRTRRPEARARLRIARSDIASDCRRRAGGVIASDDRSWFYWTEGGELARARYFALAPFANDRRTLASLR